MVFDVYYRVHLFDSVLSAIYVNRTLMSGVYIEFFHESCHVLFNFLQTSISFLNVTIIVLRGESDILLSMQIYKVLPPIYI